MQVQQTSSTTALLPLKVLLPILSALVAISPLAIDLYLPAMPTLAVALGSDSQHIQNTLSIYLLGYALGLIVFGPMADKKSRRALVIFGLSGFTITSLLLPWCSQLWQFISLRFIQAFIASAATVVVPGTIRERYGLNTAKGLSYVSMIMMLAPLVAPSLGSAILLVANWQAIFYFLGGYAALLLLVVIGLLPERQQFNATQYSFIQRYAIVFRHKLARFDIATSMLVSFSFFSYLTAIPFVYMTVFKVSELHFSILFGLNVFAFMLAHFINTRLVAKLGSRRLLLIGLAISLTASLLLVLSIYGQLPLTVVAILMFPLLGSLSLIAANSDALVLNEFAEHSGTATAVIGTLRFGIGALAGPILSYFYNGSALPFSLMMFSALVLIALAQVAGRHSQQNQS